MALVPSRADLLLTNAVPAERVDGGAPVETWVSVRGRKPIHIRAQTMCRAIGIQLPEVIIERAVLLHHEDDVIDHRRIGVAGVLRRIATPTAAQAGQLVD